MKHLAIKLICFSVMVHLLLMYAVPIKWLACIYVRVLTCVCNVVVLINDMRVCVSLSVVYISPFPTVAKIWKSLYVELQ